jgi:hypothetical protein
LRNLDERGPDGRRHVPEPAFNDCTARADELLVVGNITVL